MRRTAFLIAFTSILFTVSALDAGTTNQQFTVVKDPQAVAVIQTAITAMGGAQALLNYQDSVANGTLTKSVGSNPVSFPIVLMSKGRQETRVELQRANGMSVRIVNQGQGAIQRADGTVVHLSMNNTLAERVNHVPLLSILADYQDGKIALAYRGSAQVNGQTTDVVAISFVPTNDPVQGPLFSKMTETLFYVDQTTSLIDKIQYRNNDEGSSNGSQLVELYLSNYQAVNGIVLPLHQITYADGSLDSDLILNNVTFNVGLSDSQFVLPQ
jgi:hypothetical protein